MGNKKSKALAEELRRANYDPDPVRVWKLSQDKESVQEQDAEQNVADEDEDEDVSAASAPVKVADFDYLLDMPMRTLTYERKEDLLKKKQQKMAEYDILRSKSAADLWRIDLDHFLEVLHDVEEGEQEKPKKMVKMPMLKQKKKQLVAEVLPSPKGRRILPVIDAELRKKVEQANKAKDARIKKALKSPDKDVSIEKDAFDLEELNNKSLNEKLGSPLKGAKKKAAPKKGDAMKQTKLSFGAVAKKDTSTADESEPDEFDLMLEDAVPLREKTSRRAAVAAPTKYTDDVDDVDSDEMREDDIHVSDSDEEFEFDRPKATKKKAAARVFGSDDEVAPIKKAKKPEPLASVSSDDLFDSLIGKSTPKKEEPKVEPLKVKASAHDVFTLESDDDDKPVPVQKGRAPKKTGEAKAKAAPKRKAAPRKVASDSDEDDIFDKTKSGDDKSDVEEFDVSDVKPKQRGPRARKTVKYDFDSGSDSM